MMATAAAVTAALLFMAPTSPSPAGLRPVLEVATGGMLIVTWLLLRLEWRLRPSGVVAWVAIAAAMVGATLVAVALPDLLPAVLPAEPAPRALVRLLVAVTGAAAVVQGLRSEGGPDPLRVRGLLVPGAVVAVAWAAALPAFVLSSTIIHAAWTMVALMYTMAAVSVYRGRRLPPRTRRCTGLVVVALAVSQVATSRDVAASALGIPAAFLAAGAGLAAVAACFDRLWASLEDRDRSTATLETRVAELETETRHEAELLHELRSTVAGISAAARLLQSSSPAEAAPADLQRTMCAEIERLNRLIAEDCSSGRRQPVAEVDLDEALRPVIEAHRLRGHMVTWEPCGTRARVRPDSLAAVLDILIDNSHEHTLGSPSRVEVSRDRTGVAIEVSDAGPGIQPEVRERLFEWGAHGSSSNGHGIGLHVARRLMTEQGGSLTCAASPEEGTSFVLRLPPPTSHEERNGSQRQWQG
jgi:signal transduction histidine kinase